MDRLLLSCEHGRNRVPEPYRHLFRSRRARAALGSHQGYDLGALGLARALQRRFRVPLICGTVTRLLVELNRSMGHPKIFSEFSVKLSEQERETLLRQIYLSHRRRVETALRRSLGSGAPVLHLAVHSFTPRLKGVTRQADVGLLYDPQRPAERNFCARWVASLCQAAPELRVRRNYPYRGRNDGLTTALRRVFSPGQYLGIELEVNQRLLTGSRSDRIRLTRAVCGSLAALLG